MTLGLACYAFASAVAISAQVAPARTKASLEGRVISSTTGAPLAKAMVTLDAGNDKKYRALSGKDGTFLFEDIEPDDYSITVTRVGYVENELPEMAIEPGEHKKDLQIKLAPQGVISGRVLDEDGDPVPQAQVVCYRSVGVGAKKHVLESSTKGVDGEAKFTFTDLKPGRYYLLAGDGFSQDRERPTGNRAEEALGATYYPNAPDAMAATPLQISAGTEIRNLEIRLRKVRVVRVRGKIANPGEGQPSGVYLKTNPRAQPDVGFRTATIRNGAFEFTAVEPGSYFLETDPNLSTWDRKNREFRTTTATLFGRRTIEIGAHDIDDLTLELKPAIEVTGKIHMDGKVRKGLFVSLDSSSVYLRGTLEAEPAEDGSFRIGPLPPVEWKVKVSGLPEATYVKSIRYGGQEVARAIDLSSPATGDGILEITLAPSAATITGVVRDPKGEPVPYITVFAFTNEETFQAATTASDGSFEIKNLAPGDVHVSSWEEDVFEDLALRKFFAKQIPKVTLKEGSRERVELTLITKEAIEAAELK